MENYEGESFRVVLLFRESKLKITKYLGVLNSTPPVAWLVWRLARITLRLAWSLISTPVSLISSHVSFNSTPYGQVYL